MRRYLDYNATSPVLASVAAAVEENSLLAIGNPSSMHWAGRDSRRILDDARDRIAQYFNVEPGCIVFTSGGSEANNLAISSQLLQITASKQVKVITTAIEHPSVLETLKVWCSRLGLEVVIVAPDENGCVAAESVIAQLDQSTALVSMMWANNETGVVQPVSEVVAACKKNSIPVLIDGVQALGKLPMNLAGLNADFVSLSAHKIGGPKGVGCLVVRRGVKIEPWLLGGGQERGRRSGTENVPGAKGFSLALGQMDYRQTSGVRDHFESVILDEMPDVHIYGSQAERIANTSMFSVPGMDGETLLMQLDLAGFAVASGSACSSGKREPSHVLRAMGVSETVARSSLRVSFGPDHTYEDADALVYELKRIRELLSSMAGR